MTIMPETRCLAPEALTTGEQRTLRQPAISAIARAYGTKYPAYGNHQTIGWNE